MGFVDCDTHVLECEETWDYFDPAERGYRPVTLEHPDANGPGADSRRQYFVIGDTVTRRFAPNGQTWGYGRDYTADVSYLRDPAVRLREMDALGIDVQILFSTDYLSVGVEDPGAEAALARSYNRWIADRTAGTGGRLQWGIVTPTLNTERAYEELEFGKRNGAAGVFLKGDEHGRSLADPYFFPLYRKAEELDLTICVHAGFNRQRLEGLPFTSTRPRPGNMLQNAFSAILNADGITSSRGTGPGAVRTSFHELFPTLRFAFLEGGASWVPGMFEARRRALAASKADNWIATEHGTALKIDRIDAAAEMERRNLWVAAFATDDLPYLSHYLGPNHLVIGTDYCHNDAGTDPLAHLTTMARPDLDPEVARKICDDNARAAYNIPADFTPTGPVKLTEGIAETV